MIDRTGILETGIKKCRPISDELTSTHSKDVDRARRYGRQEFRMAVNVHMDRKFNLLDKRDPDLGGFISELPEHKKLALLESSKKKLRQTGS